MAGDDSSRFAKLCAFAKLWVWPCAGIVTLLALYGVRWYAGVDDPAPAAPARPTVVAEIDKDGLRVEAFADKSRVGAGQRVRLWVSVQHRSGSLRDVRVAAFDGGAFRPSGDCWSGGLPDCAAGSKRPGGLGAARDAGRGAVGLWGELEAPRVAGGHLLTLSFAAPDAQGAARVHILAVGPIDVGAAPDSLAAAARHVYGVAKDFGLPIVGAVLAYLFRSWQRRRESAEAARQRERDRAEREWQTDREESQDTWQTVFPRAYENAEKHWLPVIATAGQFLHHVGRLPAGNPDAEAAQHPEARQALFHLLLVVRRMSELRQRGGALFLMDLPAEEAAACAWHLLLTRIQDRLGSDVLTRVVDAVDLGDSFLSLEAKLIWPGSGLRALREKLVAWARSDDFDLDRDVLRVFMDTLQYEIDGLCSRWYGERSAPPSDRVEGLIARLEPRMKPAEGQAKAADPTGELERKLLAALTAYRHRLLRRSAGSLEGQADAPSPPQEGPTTSRSVDPSQPPKTR